MKELRNRHALVTGGNRGIGLAVAEKLLSLGAVVTITGRDVGALAQSAAALSAHGRAVPVAMHVTDGASVAQAFAAARAAHGPVDILVNNAGQAVTSPFRKSDASHWRRMLEVNLVGTMSCSHEALPDMLARGWGRIVNVASTAGLKGYAYATAYCAAKHGVVGFTRALATELVTKNITVNAVCPGYTDTDIVRNAIANIVSKTGRSEAEARAEVTKSNPQGRLVEVEEVADAVAWLCLPGSGSMTGQSIAVAGGEVM